jgi:hypothetical protein
MLAVWWAWAAGLAGRAGRPGQGTPTEYVDMRMEHRLASARTGVEHQTITIVTDALGDRDAMRLAHDLSQQSVRSRGQRRGIRMVFLWDDKHMDGCLRVDIAERHRAVALHNTVGRELAGGNLAERAIGHPKIVSGVPRPPRTGQNASLLEHVRNPRTRRGR